MKKIIISFSILIFAMFSIMINSKIMSHTTYATSGNSAEIVMELNTKRVVYSLNQNERKYIDRFIYAIFY